MPFIKKFLLAYFGAIAAAVLWFIALQLLFVSTLGLFLFSDNVVSRTWYVLNSPAEAALSVWYGIALAIVVWFVARKKGWQKKEWLLLAAVSVATWAIVFTAYRAQQTERRALSQQQEQAREDLTAQVARLGEAETRFVSVNTDAPIYEGMIRIMPGVPGTYEYEITVTASVVGGATRTIASSIEIEATGIQHVIPFQVSVRDMVREAAERSLSTQNAKTGFDATFGVAATLQLKKDRHGLLINGAPMDVNSLLANDTIFVLWNNGAMHFSERQKDAAEGEACAHFFDCQNISCPKLDERGCGYSKSCQQGRCVCQVVCS